MANRTRAVDESRRMWHQRRVVIGGDLRSHRQILGVRQKDIGAAIGVSGSEVSRRERGDAPSVTVRSLFEHAAAVGLRVTLSMHPIGGGVRDAAQLRLIHRFLERVSSAFQRELEAVIPALGDLRAIDLVLRGPGIVIAVEAITRLADIQAQIRPIQQKARDIGATRLIIVVAATHANRRALDEARPALAGAWDHDARRVLAALAQGKQPERNALILV